jgi:hypothetical protein
MCSPLFRCLRLDRIKLVVFEGLRRVGERWIMLSSSLSETLS